MLMQRPHPARSCWSAQRIDFGQGNAGDRLGDQRRAALRRSRRPLLLDRREPELALAGRRASRIDRGWSRPAALQEALRSPARARRRAGPCFSSLTSGCASGRPSTTSARRRGVDIGIARVVERAGPAAVSFSVTRRLQILRRPRLHARRDFLGEAVRAGVRAIGSSACRIRPRCEPALRSSPWRARARGRYRPRARSPDHAARVEQVEAVARLDALVIGRQRQRLASEQRLAFLLGVVEMPEQHARCRRARNCSAENSSSARRNTSP